jgi:DNA modification methylase
VSTLSHDIFLNGRVTQWCGDARAVLAQLPADHFDCVVTSPPYWGLRDYGVAGQLGLERSLGEHLQVMVAVFREIRRVLKPTGTFWLNYGDCYATAPNGRSAADTKAAGSDDRTFRDKPFSTIGPIYPPEPGQPFPPGIKRRGGGNAPAYGLLKPGDLCMVPNRLAIALQDDGWWVKAECVWGKDNPMPDSSGTYRPSSAHEKVWLFAKSDECELWRARDTGELSTAPDLTERCELRGDPEREGCRWIRMPFYYDAVAVRQPAIYADSGRQSANKSQLSPDRKRNGKNGTAASFRAITENRLLRNFEPAPLIVWEIATSAFPEAHFATFPVTLADRCIKAGSPVGGLVLDCFGGAGTTALAAVAAGRSATLIELNPEYCKLARARIEAAFMGKDEGSRHMVRQLGKAVDAGPLFAETPYDPADDFAKSLEVGYQAIRERVAKGGPRGFMGEES